MSIQWTLGKAEGSKNIAGGILKKEAVNKVVAFHRQFEKYHETPLWSLNHLATRLGVSEIHVKDESYRFGLKSFKALGGLYAIGKCIAEKLGKDISRVTPEELKACNTEKVIGKLVFATATDGNHGKGVAWVSHMLGYPSFVFMPAGTTKEREENIRKYGATTFVTDMNYDQTVDLVVKKAVENGWTVIQDTAWEGYEKVPEWIIQGYSAIAAEAIEQLERSGAAMPTHIFLQAGVGAFASSITGYFRENVGTDPLIAVVEPDQADCIYRSAKANAVVPVTGAMRTIMCGLACGIPNPIGWKILSRNVNVFVSVPDWVSAQGMRVYGNPLHGDPYVESGESGAVTMGMLYVTARDPKLADLKRALKLDGNSRVLLISTEGATDENVYRDVVWNGNYSFRQNP